MTADKVIQRDSDPFPSPPLPPLAAGDTVLVTIGRDASNADVYGEVGVLRVTGIVYSAS
jgi:hypothetical protein